MNEILLARVQRLPCRPMREHLLREGDRFVEEALDLWDQTDDKGREALAELYESDPDWPDRLDAAKARFERRIQNG